MILVGWLLVIIVGAAPGSGSSGASIHTVGPFNTSEACEQAHKDIDIMIKGAVYVSAGWSTKCVVLGNPTEVLP